MKEPHCCVNLSTQHRNGSEEEGAQLSSLYSRMRRTEPQSIRMQVRMKTREVCGERSCLVTLGTRRNRTLTELSITSRSPLSVRFQTPEQVAGSLGKRLAGVHRNTNHIASCIFILMKKYHKEKNSNYTPIAPISSQLYTCWLSK